jgi:uncharacterized protein (DUF58 family)
VDADALRERVRRLAFASPALARAFESGDFRSVFRGRGIEFDSLREYSPDDDERLIDWSATARLRSPFVRTYREERSLTVFLAVDVSASMDQGSGELSKLDAAVLVSSLVAYAAQLRGLSVGCLLFARGVVGGLAPRRGKDHALAVAQAAAAYAAGERRGEGLGTEAGFGGRGGPGEDGPSGGSSVEGGPADASSRGASDLPAREAGLGDGAPPEDAPGRGGRRGSELGLALGTISRALKRRSLVLVVSDFRAEGWERPLSELARRHDAVAIRISDRSDLEPPSAGSFEAVDPETGEAAWLPFGSRRFRAAWREAGTARRRACVEACASSRVGLLEVDSSDDPALRLLEFFERRRAR